MHQLERVVIRSNASHISLGMYSQRPFKWYMTRLSKLKISWRRQKQYTSPDKLEGGEVSQTNVGLILTKPRVISFLGVRTDRFRNPHKVKCPVPVHNASSRDLALKILLCEIYIEVLESRNLYDGLKLGEKSTATLLKKTRQIKDTYK